MKLDSKDAAILKALEDDGRALIKDISRKTRIPRDSVNYRIKRMRKEGVIKGFAAVCDVNKLGFPVYTWVHLQLQQFDDATERRFKQFLKNQPNVVYIAKLTGAYHYLFVVAAKTVQDLDKILRTILAAFPGAIKSYNTSLLVEEIQYDTFHRLVGQH